MKGVDKFLGTFAESTVLMIPTSSVYKYTTVTSDTINTIELK